MRLVLFRIRGYLVAGLTASTYPYDWRDTGVTSVLEGSWDCRV